MNQELTNNAKVKLTKRHMMNERARLAQQLCKVNDRLIAIGMGDVKANPTQVTALKTIQSKLLSDISPDDFERATEEPKTQEENIATAASVMSNPVFIKGVVKSHVKDAIKCRDMLNELLPTDSKVLNIEQRQQTTAS